MVDSPDILGKKPNPIRLMWLRYYYKAIFGGEDIGTQEFATFGDLIKDNSDRTYEEIKRLLFSYASSDIISDLKDISEEEKKLESQQEEYLTEELSKLEIGGMALDKMNRDKAEIERLKAENAELKKRPKKTSRKKAEPVLISKPPTKLEQFEQQKIRGEDFDWLHKFIISDGLDDLAEASRLVELPDIKLSTEERDYLSGLIEQKRKEALAVHPKVEIEVLKKITHKKPERAPEIRTSRELTKKREEKEQGIERERLPEFQAVQYTYQSINPENGRRFFKQYQKYLPEILREGIGKWLEVHREIYVFPLTSKNIFALATALEHGLKSPTTLREVVAQRVVLKHTIPIIEQGVNYGTSQYDFKKDYIEFNAENKLPEFNKFKQIVIDLISSGKIFSFE